MVRLLLNKEEIKYVTTIFPDNTSQVWKIELPRDADKSLIEVQWLFENEAELIHVCQLIQLLRAEVCTISSIQMPYLPYGRQDKQISNGQSFALQTFKNVLLSMGINNIVTFDAHSNTECVSSVAATTFHKSIFHHDVVCFPDKGAAVRYGTADAFGNTPIIHCEKIRNQATGEITGLKVVGGTPDLLFNKRVLIVDDICDGGMTLIKVTEALNQFQPKQVDLAVSHGLFSKGERVLNDAGITKIFTTNSLLRNPGGFKVW